MCPQDCSEEEMASIKTLIPNFFGTLNGKLLKIWRNFFWWSAKDAIYASRGAFDQKSFQISSRNLFTILESFCRQGCQTCNLCVRSCFLNKGYILRKLFVCIFIFRVWAEDFCIFVHFWHRCQNSIPGVQRNIPRKRISFQKK